jgi:hypothetical protein
MKSNYVLIELYSDMPTNEIEDCKMAGDLIQLPYKDGMKLVGILLDQHVEFAVSEIGECLIDRSYKYWE